VIAGGVLYILLKYLVPLMLNREEVARNRDLPILLAMVTAVGAAWASHKLGLSPALGAFFAGLVLGESPFATAIRGDIAPLRTLFVTLFFSSIGMLADPAWAVEHWALLATVVAAIVLGKAAITCAVVRLFRSTLGHAVAAGVCLAQVGEFSFVLAEVAREGELIDAHLFKLVVSATVATLFLTPYLVVAAPRLAAMANRLSARGRKASLRLAASSADPVSGMTGHVIIVGFGPAGQRIAEALVDQYSPLIVVVELNPKSARVARTRGLNTYIGDATSLEVLEHLRVGNAHAVVVTVPDPAAARQVIAGVRSLSPETPVLARARYHIYRWDLTAAGAEVVIDEEDEVGRHLASAALRILLADKDAAGDKAP
jgi:CPA2 family monovalent cation:H+ antiporter-2